jgi:hypothetical protein
VDSTEKSPCLHLASEEKAEIMLCAVVVLNTSPVLK